MSLIDRAAALRRYVLRDAGAWTDHIGALGNAAPSTKAHLTRCVDNFASAVRAGLEERAPDVDPHFRGHGIEGSAMGAALLDGFVGGERRTRAIDAQRGIVRGLVAAGIGMAWARVRGGASAIPIEANLSRHGYDGLAFARLIAEPALARRRSFLFRDVPPDAHADAWRGAGRALWFLCAGDLDALSRALAAMPEQAAEGAGIASIFSGGVSAPEAWIDERPSFGAGAALGSELRRATCGTA